jgi:beta-lactam-binding protein with PASTA domain
VGQDLVVTSDPPAESVLPRGASVALLVSTGQGPEEFVMPDLSGRELNGVHRQLEALGFRVEVPPAAPSIGAIVSQSPPPGSRVTRDAVVTLQATGRFIR